MSAWPPEDEIAVYEPPVTSLSETLSPAEVAARLAAERVRQGLPAGQAELEEVLERRVSDDPWLQSTLYTQAEDEEMEMVSLVDERIQDLLQDNEEILVRREVGWRQGRHVLTIYLSEDQADVRRMLLDEVGTERVIIKPARFTVEETATQSSAIWDARDELLAAGVQLIGSSARPSGEITLDFWAFDRQAAEQALFDRFGEIVQPQWKGASAGSAFRAFPFGSWLCEDKRLTVFYGLPHNGERFGGCLVFETERAVLVSLQILAPHGWKTLLGGFTPAHATLGLQHPVGDRSVVDDSVNRARPHWTQVTRTLG